MNSGLQKKVDGPSRQRRTTASITGFRDDEEGQEPDYRPSNMGAVLTSCRLLREVRAGLRNRSFPFAISTVDVRTLA